MFWRINMFCNKCGAQIPDGTKFCNKCGAPIGDVNLAPTSQSVPEANPVSINNTAPVNNAVPSEPHIQQPVNGMMPPKKPINIKALVAVLCSVVVVIVAVVILIVVLTAPPKIDANDYVEVEFSGYNTIGTADVEVDTDKLVKKYGKKIKGTDALKKLKKNNYYGFSDMTDAEIFAELLEDSIYVSGNYNLSNGDTIEVKWDLSEVKEIKKYFKVDLEYRDMKVEVEGLEKAKKINPFEDLEVSFSGTDGRGELDYTYKGKYDFSFYGSPNWDLSEGDVVTIKVYGSEDSYIDEGIILTQLEKDYTVEGLSKYATELDDVSEDALSTLQDKTEDIIISEFAGEDYFEVDSAGDVGYYFLNSKESDTYTHNKLIIVYLVNFKSLVNEDCMAQGFFAVEFSNGLIDKDGNFNIDTSNYNVSYHTFEAYYDNGKYDYDWLRGYESLSKLENDYIMSYYADYTIEYYVLDMDAADSEENDVETEED